jgi:hypothetical protein
LGRGRATWRGRAPEDEALHPAVPQSIGKSNGLFHQPPHHPVLGAARTPRPGAPWTRRAPGHRPQAAPARPPPARTAAHGQDGWLGTGRRHGWSCARGGLIQTRRELEEEFLAGARKFS